MHINIYNSNKISKLFNISRERCGEAYICIYIVGMESIKRFYLTALVYLVVVFLALVLSGCGLWEDDFVVLPYPEVCENGCKSNFTNIFQHGENGLDYRSITDGNSYHRIFFDTASLTDRPGYFSIVIEATKPDPFYKIGDLYDVGGYFSSNAWTLVSGERVPIGKWTSKFSSNSLRMDLYSKPPSNKLATKYIVGPIYKGFVTNRDTLDLYMKADFTEAWYNAPRTVVYDTLKVILMVK